MIKDENATSPIIMSYRRAEAGSRIEEIKQIIREMYADYPIWLQLKREDGFSDLNPNCPLFTTAIFIANSWGVPGDTWGLVTSPVIAATFYSCGL